VDWPTTNEIQTIAAIVQGIAAAVFLGSVVWDARARRNERQRRARLAEQERRDRLAAALRRLWFQSNWNIAHTYEESSGFDSPRIIDFINQQLETRGETWRYPLVERSG
jgi:hypothetical protein